jgi:3',5'-nucleoside bisphosphate phosphatase
MRQGLDVEAVIAQGGPRPPDAVTRLHLARALVARRCVCSTTAAFADWIGDEHAADADLPPFPAVSVVAAAIRAAGGVAILAHPGQHGDPAVIDALMADGLDGCEVRHPRLDPGLQDWLDGRAAAAGWWRSAGSDLHWLGARRPGMCALPPEAAAVLVRRLGLGAGVDPAPAAC